MRSMTKDELKAWTTARRGRMVNLAGMIGVTRGCVNAYAYGWEDIPTDRYQQLMQAMRRIERAEAILDSKVMRRKVK